MKIDAHQHFWTPQRENDYGFLTQDAGVLYQEHLPEHLYPLLFSHGVQYSIVVQAAPTVKESEYLLNLVDSHDFVAGVVGWIDLDTDYATFLGVYNKLRQHRKFIGIRPMLQSLEDDRWILRTNVLKNLEILAAEQFPFDILVYPHHLPYINEMLKAVPRLRAVVNHIAKPPIHTRQLEPCGTWIKEIGQHSNVWCKLSGMVTEADLDHWKLEDLAPYVDHVLDCFGSERVMFGSDWPVCLLAASYEQVYNAIEQLLTERLDPEACKAIFGDNAACFYKLKWGK